MARSGVRAVCAALALSICFVAARAEPVDQGAGWTEAARSSFRHTDQGSRLLALAWLRALTQRDGTPLLAALPRYGFLPDADATDGLPIGFTEIETPRGVTVGLGCAACHTREIVADGKALRIDGAPALADIGAFLADLDDALQRTLASEAAFTPFAQSVLGDRARDSTARDILKVDVRFLATRLRVLVGGALPRDIPWGPGRYDLLGMAFDTLAGLSVGPSPLLVLPANVKPADAPVRAAPLWGAARQDRMLWTGIAAGGDESLALARSLAELTGSFGRARPISTPGALGPLDRDYLLHNTANFDGLAAQDGALGLMGAPAWPGPLDKQLAAAGSAVFERPEAQGGCAGCHGEAPGARPGTWRTPIVDAGTDTRAGRLLAREIATGSMAGASVPGTIAALRPNDGALAMLRIAVTGAMLGARAEAALKRPVSTVIGRVFSTPETTPVLAEAPVAGGYAARVLHGIWAAAPYLHDGAVPTLADLLQPPDARPKSFAVGPAYDLGAVGLARRQAPGSFTLKTTGCDEKDSGRSNCGHDYGTRLSDTDKRALLEYLKSL